MLEAMARIAPSQPNEAMALFSKLFSKVQIDSKRGLGSSVSEQR
jgi:hypothetical protein